MYGTDYSTQSTRFIVQIVEYTDFLTVQLVHCTLRLVHVQCTCTGELVHNIVLIAFLF